MIFIRNAIVRTLCFLMIMPPQWALAAEPIVIDGAAAAANQAALATTPSGKAMLNIVAPNAAGVSHNKFTNFNVTTEGLVINNATALATTNLAGVIEANPNFGGSAASLILNEVTSANRSTLNGMTEIGGQAADYILANPNGITCDGCGFINTPRATLTTGTPTFNGNALAGLSVSTGDVLIEGLGLDATKVDKFDIVTRAATINAQINAKDLGIHAGRQDFDYAARAGVAKAADGSTKPAFAIDSTALGGMYAGRITLVGTEAGLGVRVAGDMAASSGDMVLSANGKLELKANLSAATTIQIASTASDIVVDKTVYAGTNLNATTSAGTVKVNTGGSLGAAGDVTVQAAQIEAAGGKIVAGLDGAGAMTTNGTLSLNATNKITAGEGFLGGGASVIFKAPTIDLSRATDDNSETVRSRGTLRIETGNVTATNGRIASDGTMVLAGNSPIVIGAGLYKSASSITVSGDSVTSAATLTADGTLNVTSTTGDITNSGTMAAGTTTTLNAAANITNTGTIQSQTGTTITAAGTLTNASGAKIKSAQNTTVTTGGLLTNAGSIYAVNATTLSAPTISNTGSIAGGTNLDINVASLTNLAGVLHAQNNFTVKGYGGATRAVLFDNASGYVETINGKITINADTLNNRKSIFTAGSVLAIQTAVAQGSCAQMDAYNELCLRSYYPFSTPMGTFMINDWTNYSPIGFYYTGVITADSASGLISSGGDITLSGMTISNDKSTLSAVGDINISSTTFNNESAAFYNEAYYSRGGVALLGRESAGTVDSLVQAGGNLTITSTDGVRNGTEQLYNTPPAGAAQSNFADFITAPTPSALLNTSAYADLIPGRDALFVASVAPKPKFVFETRVDFITVQNYYGSDYFVNQLGKVTPESISTRLGDAYFDTTLVRQAILQETGKRWLDATVKDDIQQMKALLDGGVQAGQDLQLAFGVALSASQIAALTTDIVWYVEEQYQGRTVLVPKVYLALATRATLDSRGAILAGDNVTVTAATIDNDHSIIKADTNAALTASSDITSISAKINAGNNINMTSTGGGITIESNAIRRNTGGGNIMSFLDQQATISAGGALTITAADDITITGAKVTSGGDTSLAAVGNVTVGEVQLNRKNVGGIDSLKETISIGSTVDAGGNLSISSGNAARVKASTLTATGDLSLQATGDVVVESAADSYNVVGRKYALHTITQKSAELSAGGDVTVGSLVGNASVIASKVDSGGDITLNTPGGTLYLGARKDYFEERISETKSGMGGMMTTYINRGTIDETVVPTLMTANGNLAIVTGDGVIVDYKDTGSLTGSIDQLSQAPGLAWMKQVQARGDVQWNAIEELHKSWDYRSQGISPVGAALISLAVGWATAGMGADLAGVIAEGSTAASGMATGGTLITSSGSLTVVNGYTVAALNAGFTSLASQAATAIVGNGGDLGAALKQLGSMDTIKALATSMVTAGLIEGLGVSDALSAPTDNLSGSALKMTDFANKLKVGIAQASISATVDSIINGAPLGDNLKNGLINAAVTVVGAEAAGAIGDATRHGDLNTATQLIAHAALGCGMGEVVGGDCASGAGGAVVGEITAIMYGLQTEGGLENDVNNALADNDTQKALALIAKWENTGVDLAKLTGGLSAAIAGGDVDVAALAGGNAAENNALCLGMCVGAAALVAAIYTYHSGDGDFVAGVEAIGAGDDPLSQVIETGVTQTVELSYEAYPDETKATLDVIGGLGGAIDAKVQYIDDVTGNTVSGYWNSLDESTQNRIKGGAALVSVILPAGSVTKLAKIKKLPNPTRGDSVAISKQVNAETVSKISESQSSNSLNTFADNLADAGVTTVDPSQLNRKFWTTETDFSGNKVFQRNDLFDPNQVSTWTKNGKQVTGTNLKRMSDGRAPIGADGNSVSLHHMTQTQGGAIAELTQTFHTQNYGTIHINTGQLPSGITRSQFNRWREQYWKNRSITYGE